jgi:hypothetical protein
MDLGAVVPGGRGAVIVRRRHAAVLTVPIVRHAVLRGNGRERIVLRTAVQPERVYGRDSLEDQDRGEADELLGCPLDHAATSGSPPDGTFAAARVAAWGHEYGPTR